MNEQSLIHLRDAVNELIEELRKENSKSSSIPEVRKTELELSVTEPVSITRLYDSPKALTKFLNQLLHDIVSIKKNLGDIDFDKDSRDRITKNVNEAYEKVSRLVETLEGVNK